MSDYVQLYQGISEKHNAAYDNFRKVYEKEHPMPMRGKLSRDDWYVSFALIIMIIASVIVSGSRTVEEFGGGAIGIAAFVMLEGAIITYAFFRTRTDFDETRIKDVRKLAQRGLFLAFVVAVGANINAVLKAHGISTSDHVATAINILVAISAPTLAFISGDVMALESMKSISRQRKMDATFEQDIVIWKEGLDKTWIAQRGNWGVKIRVESVPLELPSLSNGNSIGNQPSIPIPAASTLGHKKEADATRKAISHLEQNAEIFLSWKKSDLVNELKSIGVGKSTAYKVVDRFFEGHQNAVNGSNETDDNGGLVMEAVE